MIEHYFHYSVYTFICIYIITYFHYFICIFCSAGKQAEVQKTIDELKHEVDKRDLDIKILQKNLKEAENVLV